MANGANRLFDVIKQTGESTNGISSQVVSLTIKSVNPLILMRDDRLEIPAEFCILHKSLNINTFRINDIVTAIVLNNGQQYFILYNNTAEEQRINYNDLDNKPKINNVELIGNKTSNDLGLNNYSNLDNKPKINGIELSGNKTSDDLLIVSKSELQQIVQDMTTNINSKVNKSGDTLTGELLFNNKNDYGAIRKTRTLNGTDYELSVGVGGNGSARMEYINNNNVLGSIEVRSNGLYNGVSGKKLVEQITTEWIYASRQNLTDGTIRYQKIGNIAIVHIADIKSSSNLGNGTILATGLPKGATGYLFLLSRYNSSGSDTDCRVRINENGELYIHYDTFYSGDNQYYGQAIYLCQ